MQLLQTGLLASLVVVVLVQIVHRLFGTILALAWCLVAIGYGAYAFAHGAKVVFLERFAVEPWAFVVFMGALAAYNLFVAARLVRRRVKDRAEAKPA